MKKNKYWKNARSQNIDEGWRAKNASVHSRHSAGFGIQALNISSACRSECERNNLPIIPYRFPRQQTTNRQIEILDNVIGDRKVFLFVLFTTRVCRGSGRVFSLGNTNPTSCSCSNSLSQPLYHNFQASLLEQFTYCSSLELQSVTENIGLFKIPPRNCEFFHNKKADYIMLIKNIMFLGLC